MTGHVDEDEDNVYAEVVGSDVAGVGSHALTQKYATNELHDGHGDSIILCHIFSVALQNAFAPELVCVIWWL